MSFLGFTRSYICLFFGVFLLVALCAPQLGFAQDAAPPEAQVPDLEFLTGESQAPVVLDVGDSVSPPDSEQLVEPVQSAVEIPDMPAQEEEFDENLFFDSEDLVPSGEVARTGPRKVNPAVEPASKFIVVRKNAGAHSRSARLVAAERAIKLGRYDAALEMYNRLYETRRRDPNVLMGRALSLQHLGRIDEAILAYQGLLDVKPGNLAAEINMLGLMARQYPAVSLQRLLDLREKHPENASVAAQASVVYAHMGRYNEALQYLGIAASMEPHNASHLFNIAVIADRAGKKKEAVEYYEKALEVDTIYGGGRGIARDTVYERLAQLR